MSNKPNQEKNEFVLGSSMLPGEQILWQSETGKFGLMSGVYGRKVLTKWIVTIVVMLAIIGAYVMTVDPIKNSVVVMLLIVTALMLISPVMEWNNLKGQRYILTNQRAILVRADRKISTMPLSAIDDAQIVQLTPEETCLLLGSKMMAEPEKQYRFRAAHPLGATEETGNAEGLLFYGIQNADQALQLVSQRSAA